MYKSVLMPMLCKCQRHKSINEKRKTSVHRDGSSISLDYIEKKDVLVSSNKILIFLLDQ